MEEVSVLDNVSERNYKTTRTLTPSVTNVVRPCNLLTLLADAKSKRNRHGIYQLFCKTQNKARDIIIHTTKKPLTQKTQEVSDKKKKKKKKKTEDVDIREEIL